MKREELVSRLGRTLNTLENNVNLSNKMKADVLLREIEEVFEVVDLTDSLNTLNDEDIKTEYDSLHSDYT